MRNGEIYRRFVSLQCTCLCELISSGLSTIPTNFSRNIMRRLHSYGEQGDIVNKMVTSLM
ncbi:hypothetical protein C0J52_01898 [Blattella germanica]|nr:hypothetical protein C0J52_01898 [Blattella germanica]